MTSSKHLAVTVRANGYIYTNMTTVYFCSDGLGGSRETIIVLRTDHL